MKTSIKSSVQKINSVFIISLFFLLLSSCSKDDESSGGNSNDPIIGKWKVSKYINSGTEMEYNDLYFEFTSKGGNSFNLAKSTDGVNFSGVGSLSLDNDIYLFAGNSTGLPFFTLDSYKISSTTSQTLVLENPADPQIGIVHLNRY